MQHPQAHALHGAELAALVQELLQARLATPGVPLLARHSWRATPGAGSAARPSPETHAT